MIIYAMGSALTSEMVEYAKDAAPLLEYVGDGVRMMGTWDQHFPVYEIRLVHPHILQVSICKEDGHVKQAL